MAPLACETDLETSPVSPDAANPASCCRTRSCSGSEDQGGAIGERGADTRRRRAQVDPRDRWTSVRRAPRIPPPARAARRSIARRQHQKRRLAKVGRRSGDATAATRRIVTQDQMRQRSTEPKRADRRDALAVARGPRRRCHGQREPGAAKIGVRRRRVRRWRYWPESCRAAVPRIALIRPAMPAAPSRWPIVPFTAPT